MSEPQPEETGTAPTGQPAGGIAGSRWSRPGCVTLRCRQNGPLVVEMPAAEEAGLPAFRVIDHEGREFPLPAGKRAVALCRCGRSGQRPFCDGSHRGSGFAAAETAPEPGTASRPETASGDEPPPRASS